MMLAIKPIPAFSDNYIWFITNPDADDGRAFVVDPGDAAPVIQVLERENLNLAGILVTHHHPDHVGGLAKLLSHAEADVIIYGPDNPKITEITHPLKEGDVVEVLGVPFRVIEVPGHTLDHIAFFSDHPLTPVLFCGDTLFVGGCGRIFEGTPAQMFHSLQKIASLPGNTACYCAHEYTLGNLAFAQAVEPDNTDLQQFLEQCRILRQQEIPTAPSSVANELAVNPFLRSTVAPVKRAAEQQSGVVLDSPAEVFRVTREWKDNF